MNSYFQCDKDLETGIDSIDRQHAQLVEIINESMKLSFQNDRIETSYVEDIVNRLQLYVFEHFNNEKTLMEIHQIDARHREAHNNLHQDFINRVNDAFSDMDALSSPMKLSEVNEFLIRWLAYHILNMDKSLVRQINLISIEGYTPEEAYNREINFVESSTEPLLKALKALFFLVSEKNIELEKKNFELEEKVKTRTKELEDANERLEKISIIDELTSLPNRRFVMGEIEKLIHQWERYQIRFSILFIDVDKFKNVNDVYGHDYGDQVLRWIADFLKSHIRKTDVACRLGGDEFVIICAHCDKNSAYDMGHKLNEAYRHMDRKDKLPFWEPSLSIGVAEYDETFKAASEILNKADAAMYEAKKSGGNQVHLL